MVVANVERIIKLVIPRRGDKIVWRQRLINLLHDHIHLRIQVIAAPAGYGKTTLLIDFTNDLDTPVCWYALDISDQDPKMLFEGILASIRFRFLEFGRVTESLLSTSNDVIKEAPRLINTLTGEIYKTIPEYFILVLEDYHFIEASDSARMLLNLFLEHVPENCHIIISSRTSVELPAISKMALQHNVVNLNTSSLSFTPTEVKELLDLLYGISMSIEEAEKVANITEGWVLGILLDTHRLKEGGFPRNVMMLSQRDVFRYLASEVYERQPPEIQNFLLVSSTLDCMEPQICDQLGLSNSRSMLHQIESLNLFTQCIDSEKVWYRYHHLFRKFLQGKLLEENPDQFALLHCKAASLFEHHQRWNDAITHFLVAMRYDEASRVITSVGEDFHRSGKWETVSKWINALPEDLRLSDPDLMLIQAQGLIYLGEVDKAARLLTSLLRFSSRPEDWMRKAKTLSWRSATLRLTGHFAQARRDIETAIQLLKQHGGPSDILGEAYRRLGHIHLEQGRFALAKRYLHCALKHYTSIFDIGQIAEVHNSLGIMYKRLSDLTEASVHFERARQGWQKANNPGALASVLNNIGIIYQRQGQYDLALDTLRTGLQKAQESGYRRTEACILITMAEVLRDLDLYNDALTAYQEGLELAREVMEAYFIAWATAGIGETYRLLGDHGKAEVLLKEAASQAKEQGQNYEASLFSFQLGIIEYERGRYEIAMEILRHSCDRLRDAGDKDALAKAYFHLAQASFLAKKYDHALSWLERASELADELGYDNFLVIEGRNTALLVQYGASKGIGGDRFIDIMERIKRHRHGQRWQVATELSGTVVMGDKPNIEAYALGETKVLVDGRSVSEEEWRSNRAQEIFFHLLYHRTGSKKERITTALWPDLSPAKATSNFHINLYRARRAVFPGVFTYEQGRYRLNSDLTIWFDVEDFERLVSQSSGLPYSGDRVACLEQAVELYRGPFMQEFYSEWVEDQRRELEGKYLKALSLLANFNADGRKYDKAIALLEKLIAIDSYNEEAYCQLIEWHLAVGDKVSALRVYKQYLSTVVDELCTTPSDRIQQLHRYILTAKETE